MTLCGRSGGGRWQGIQQLVQCTRREGRATLCHLTCGGVWRRVVLQTTQGVRKSKDIRRRLTKRMALWEEGRYNALVDDTVTEGRALEGRQRSPQQSLDSRARKFNGQVLAGKLRAAVRQATNRGGGGVLFPDDPCTKTGRPVLEVLKEKHPDTRVPDPTRADCSVFE
eukprot:8457338-Ditylum_brightwellii.AAC.1